MTSPGTADYLAALRAEGDRVAEAARGGEWDAPVPYCPGWVLRDVVVHLGWVYRWVGATVVGGRPPDRDRRAALQDPDPADRPGVLERFARAHADLVTALAQAPADLDCWTVWPAPSPRTFWLRRQVHETLVHRVDVQNAAGPGLRDGSDLAPGLAADGVDELVRGFLHRFGDDLHHRHPVTLGLHALDTGDRWWVRIGPGPPSAGQGHGDGPADAEVHALAGQLFLLLWNRRAADGLDVRGDPVVLEAWRTGARR